jgi:hypothetical protein
MRTAYEGLAIYHVTLGSGSELEHGEWNGTLDLLGMQEARAAFCWGKEKNERLSGKI